VKVEVAGYIIWDVKVNKRVEEKRLRTKESIFMDVFTDNIEAFSKILKAQRNQFLLPWHGLLL
jgi:hypothetical protein